MVSLGSKVKQVSQARREKEEHLDHRGWLGNQEVRYIRNIKGLQFYFTILRLKLPPSLLCIV